MKKWLFAFMFVLVVGCSNEEDSVSTKETEATTDVEQQTSEKDEQVNEATIQKEIEELQRKDKLKFTLTDTTQSHPELDLSVRTYEMTYAPEEQFIYKKYEDNFFAGKYESYLQSNDHLVIKNELGNKEWEIIEGNFEFDYQVPTLLGEFLFELLAQADNLEITEDIEGYVAFAQLSTGNFDVVEESYQTLLKTLDEIAISPNVYETLTEYNEPYSYDFTSIGIEVFLNKEQDLTRFNIVFEFNEEEENFIMLEVILYDINEEQDLTLPDEVELR